MCCHKDQLRFEHELVFLRPRVLVEHEHRKWRSTGKLIHCNGLTDSISPQQEPAHEDVGGQDTARRQQRH
jgi:hypothetical protein